jgi:hypothetical protein
MLNSAGAPFARSVPVFVFAAEGGTSTGSFSPATLSAPGVFTTIFTGILAGSASTISTTINGLAVNSTLPVVTVTPGVLSAQTSLTELSQNQVAAGDHLVIRLSPKDTAGNAYLTDDLTVSFNLGTGTSVGAIGGTTRDIDGTYIADFSAQTAGSATEILAMINGIAAAGTAPAVTVVPGASTSADSFVTVSLPTIDAGSTSLITLVSRDAFGNNLVTGGGTVAFTFGSYSGGSATGVISAVVDNNDGTYSATFTGNLSGTATTISGTIDGVALSTTLPTVVVIPGLISAAASTYVLSNTTVASGSNITANLIAKDAYGNMLTVGGSTISFSLGAGTSTGTFGAVSDASDGTYSASFTGALIGTARRIIASINGATVITTVPTITVTSGSVSLASSSMAVSVSTISSGNSATLTLTTRDAAGNSIGSGGSTVVFSGNGGTATGTFSVATDNGDGTYTGTFTGVLAGTAKTIRASIDGSLITSTLPTVAVVPGAFSLSGSTYAATPTNVAAGSIGNFHMQARDAAGNALSTGGQAVSFALSGGTSSGTINGAIDNGNGSYDSDFTGEISGNAANLDVTADGSTVTGSSVSVTVVPGPADMANSQITTPSSSIASGTSATVTLTAFDAYNNQLTSSSGTITFGFSGGTSTGSFSAVSALGNGVYQATITGIVSGSAGLLSASYDSVAVASTMPSIQVLPGAISPATSGISVSAGTVNSGNMINLALTAMDVNGNLIPSGGETIVFSFTGGTSTGSISAITDVGNGTYSATFSGVTAGTATTLGATINGNAVTSSLPDVQVLPGSNVLLQVSGISSAIAGVSKGFTVRVHDLADNTITSYLGTIAFTSSDAQAVLPGNYQFVEGDAGIRNFSATLKTAGSRSITATDTSDGLITGNQSAIGVSAAASSALRFSGAISSKAGLCSSAILIGLKDSFSNFTAAAGNVSVTLAGAGSGAFYSDDLCTSSITSTVIADTSTTKTIYFRSTADETLNFSAVDAGAMLTGAAAVFNVLPWPAWAGSEAGIALFETGVNAARGRNNGFFNTPTGIEIDEFNNIYVADSTNYRIHKFDLSNNSYVGWIGKITIVPTGGDPACPTTAVNATTPGWCMGGRAVNGNGNGQYNAAQSLYYSNGFLYVSDMTNHRIQKINATSGAFVGWMGRILTSPTGGDTGCTGAAVGTTTPGWCSGGTSQSGTGDGQYSSPKYLTGDGTNLYISDGGNFRIAKVSLATGTFLGWYGRVSTVATGGAAGCTTTAVSAVTPGWCLGGTAKTGTADGHFNSPRGIMLLGSYLYVANTGNHRIERLNLAASPLVSVAGWIGRISTSPTGGDAGCSGAAAGVYTPGWCLGGTATSGTSNGNFSSPYRVTGDSSYLYVSDYTNNRITKIGTAVPTFVGSSGRILTSPTGGDAGCAGAAVNAVTPGWCQGGTFSYGAGQGMRNSAQGLELRNGSLYIADSLNHRIEKIDPVTNISQGILGAKAIAGAAWFTVTTAVHTGAYDDKSFYLPSGVSASGSNLFVADTTNNRIQKLEVGNGSISGWLGNVWTPATGGTGGCIGATANTFPSGWCTGGNTRSGTGNGMLSAPQNVYEYGGNLYVADGTNHRISRYTTATGAFTGWVGYVSTTPTGGAAGCSTTPVNNPTPGWCAGGISKTSTGNGAMNTPAGIATDGTNLYISDRSNFRILRYNLSTGAFTGWIGRISTSPTGGDAGCSGAATTTFTPGWCLGGTAATGTANGNFNLPKGIVYDSGSLYVIDSSNHRIQRITSATGAFTGWIGRVNTTPTGGDAGCATAAVSSYTPGWCSGGTAKSGTGDGHLSSPTGLWSNGSSLYVGDTANSRVDRVAISNGGFTGWMGNISTVPTSGDSGCLGSVVGTMTPGWCKGGTSKAGIGLGMVDGPLYMSGSGVYVYTTDSNNARIMRFPQ